MLLDLILAVWVVWGAIGLYQFSHRPWPPAGCPVKGGTTAARQQGSTCTHPEVEQVEIGDGMMVPREVVAKICISCLAQLPADYSSPRSVILTDEKSVPFPYHNVDMSYWTEAQERLATGKEVSKCHE